MNDNNNLKYTLAIDYNMIGLSVYENEKSCMVCLSPAEAKELADNLLVFHVASQIQPPEGITYYGKLPKIHFWEKILALFGKGPLFKNSQLLLYSISKPDPESVELTVLQGRGHTLILKNEFALMLAKHLIDHARRSS